MQREKEHILANERGAVLITGLLILVILTMLGLVAMQSSTLQEKMAYNMTNRTLAFQAAEAALREGEALLQSAVLPVFDGSNGLYALNTNVDVLTLDWVANGRLMTDSAGNPQNLITGVAAPPRYIVEELGGLPSESGSLVAGTPLTDEVMYRVTARGVGSINAGEVILQSTFLR